VQRLQSAGAAGFGKYQLMEQQMVRHAWSPARRTPARHVRLTCPLVCAAMSQTERLARLATLARQLAENAVSTADIELDAAAEKQAVRISVVTAGGRAYMAYSRCAATVSGGCSTASGAGGVPAAPPAGCL